MSFDLEKAAAAARELSPRQHEILVALGECESRKQIADKLKISPHTVNNHMKIIYARLQIQSLSQAVRIASRISAN